MNPRRLVGLVAGLATLVGGTFAIAAPAQASPSQGGLLRLDGLGLGSVTGSALGIVSQAEDLTHVLLRRGTDGRVHVLEPKGAPLRRPSAVSPQAGPRQVARAHLNRYAKAFGARPADLRPAGTTSLAGGHVVRFDQVLDGVRVLGGELVASLDGGGALQSIVGETAPQPTQAFPALSRSNVDRLALIGQRAVRVHERLRSAAGLSVTTLGRRWYDTDIVGAKVSDGQTEPVYAFEVRGRHGLRDMVLVNARTGKAELTWSLKEEALNRVVCDARKRVIDDTDPDNYACGTALQPVRTEGQPASSVEDVNRVYRYFRDTADAYAAYDNVDLTDLIGVNYHDRNGVALRGTVRLCTPEGCPYTNAYWDGQQMAFGEGVSTRDITAHELTHGVTQSTSGLQYLYQSGAINESFSDWMGEIVDIRNGESAANRWKIGNGSSLGVIRDMRKPSAYDQPGRMTSKLWYGGTDDNGGVHENSGVGNKLAFLIAHGQEFNGYDIQGIGIAKLAKILWTTENLFPTAGDYRDLYYTVPLACRKNIGRPGSSMTEHDCKQVDKAVRATELNKSPRTGAPKGVGYCPTGRVAHIYAQAGFEDKSGWTFGKDWKLSSETGFGAYAPVGQDAAVAWTFSGDNTYLTKQVPVTLPRDSHPYLRFAHSYIFDSGDGGRLQYSTDAGTTWHNAAGLPNVNGEDSEMSIFGGAKGWTGSSYGYGSTRYNLSSLAGKTVTLRFQTKVKTDNSAWWIDNLKVYRCG